VGEVIVATTGRPLGRHTQGDDVIDPTDEDGLPRRVRSRRAEPDDTDQTAPEGEAHIATQADDARTPEQIRAMMSSFQAGLARGREAPDTDPPGRTDAAAVVDGAAVADGGQPDAAAGPAGDGGLDGGEQSGSGAPNAGRGGRAGRRRRADGGADGEATEAT
jgi:hypothetical protein